MTGNAAIQAAERARELLVMAVAEKLGVPIENISLAERRVFDVENPDVGVSFAEAVVLAESKFGTIGTVGAYSFYATKTITTGEGGMLVTDDPAIADRARLMSLHGISRTAWNRYAASGSWYYEIEDVGFKYNMTDIAAALGLVQLDRAWELLEARRHLAHRYAACLGGSQVADLIELPTDAGG